MYKVDHISKINSILFYPIPSPTPSRRAFLLEDLQVYRELFALHFSLLFSCSPWESCIFVGNKCLGDQPEVGMRKFALDNTAIGRHHVKRQFSGKLEWIRN